MRLFRPALSLAIAMVLSLAACTPHQGEKKYANDAAREAAARAGDGNEAYWLGMTACTDEPAAHHGRDTLKWLTLAARSHDQQDSGRAEHALANYYLARVPYDGGPDGEWTYDPGKTKGEVRFCTGTRRSAANDKIAEQYLKSCADKQFMASSICRETLGKLYVEQKKYAKAYKAFARIAAWHEDDMYGPQVHFDGPLYKIPSGKSRIYETDMKRIRPYMTEAARHLSRADTERMDAKARSDVRALNWRYTRNGVRGGVNK